jgi:hypothetical protein
MRDLADDTEITLGGGKLSLTRAKTRRYLSDDKTPALVDIEFNQLFEVTLDPDEEA